MFCGEAALWTFNEIKHGKQQQLQQQLQQQHFYFTP